MRTSRVALFLGFLLAAALLLVGCSKESVDPANVLGRWEGYTPGGYRVILVLESGNVAHLSKLGSGTAGFPEKVLRWESAGGKVLVRSETTTHLSLGLGDGEFTESATGLKLRRSGPLTGFRYPLIAAFVALAASWLLTPLVRKLAFRVGAVDDPKRDNRRVHKEPLPRWGGIAIFGGFVVSLLAILPFAFPAQAKQFPPYLVGILIVGALLVVVGAMDDLKQYSAKFQAAFLLFCGVAVTLFGVDDRSRILISGISWPPFTGATSWISFGMWGIPITAVYIFVVTKTMDTIDGIDGLASGIAAIGGGTLSMIATYGGQPRVALVAAALAGASVGFLRHNYNPAKIIMGTGGAYFLGFVLATLSIVGAMKTAAAVMMLVPLFVFGVPLFDAVQVVIRRRLSGVPITQADKRHIHHQLLDRGLSQRQAVWVLYVVALLLCAALLIVVKMYG